MKDCWNQIGVWSKQAAKCEKLPAVIHCRNCEVYTNAGRQALERQVPKEYSEQWMRTYAQAKTEGRRKAGSVVVFRLGREWFGLSTLYFKSIENLSFIHSIPRFSNELLIGIVNIRGTLQLCFSVANLLQACDESVDNGNRGVGVYKRLIVLINNSQYYVFPVDEVGGVERIDESTLEALPATLNERHAELVKGTIKTEFHRIALLNAPRLFSSLEAAIGGG